MTIARDLTNGIIEERNVDDIWQMRERAQILPLAEPIIVKIQKLQAVEALKDLSGWQGFNLVVAKVNFL